jgi:hypothetical protein
MIAMRTAGVCADEAFGMDRPSTTATINTPQAPISRNLVMGRISLQPVRRSAISRDFSSHPLQAHDLNHSVYDVVMIWNQPTLDSSIPLSRAAAVKSDFRIPDGACSSGLVRQDLRLVVSYGNRSERKLQTGTPDGLNTEITHTLRSE